METWMGLPPDWSAHGYHVDRLILLVHGLMLALFVGWLTYFLFALVKFRGPAVGRTHKRARGRLALSLAGVVFVCELVLMVFFEIPFWADRHEPPTTRAVTRVRVVGEQFAWNFHYPGPDGEFGATAPEFLDPFNPVGLDYDHPAAYDDVVTVNQLHVPCDRPVVLELSSKDVIHAFSIPYMRVKQDVIPGSAVTVWFEPMREGETDIGCAQLCGLGHARMRGLLTVESQADFDAWYQEELEFQ